jgi:hypothetical protein
MIHVTSRKVEGKEIEGRSNGENKREGKCGGHDNMEVGVMWLRGPRGVRLPLSITKKSTIKDLNQHQKKLRTDIFIEVTSK